MSIQFERETDLSIVKIMIDSKYVEIKLLKSQIIQLEIKNTIW